MLKQGKDYLSSDLDIFGEDTGEETTQEGDEFDIFWWAADSAVSDSDSSGEQKANTDWEKTDSDIAIDWQDKKSWDDSEVKDSKTEDIKTTDEGDNELDIDIENLFKDIEDETKWNSELEWLIDSLRNEISTITTERNILQKENSIINEKLMSKVWDESNLGIYKWVISNLESNPKLMMLVKHLWNSDSEAIKWRLVGVVTDILYDLTWEDVSNLINKNQTDKILAASWKSSSSTTADMVNKDDDKDMDYEESISSLF